MEPTVVRSLLEAIKLEDSGLIARLLEQHHDLVRAYSPFGGSTWLGYAAGEGKLHSVKALLAAGADVNQGSQRDNVAPICNAAGRGHRSVVEHLLSCSARLDTSTSIANPLIWAVTHWERADDTDIVKLLLSAGIDSTVKYPYSERTKFKMPLDAMGKALLWGTPAKAGVIAAWTATGEEQIRELLENAMIAADTHLERYRYGDAKLAEMSHKREMSLQKAIDTALATVF